VNVLQQLKSAVPESSVIFHYTSQDGLLGIIRSKSIWASSIRHLSDSAEFSYTVELVRGKLKQKLLQSNPRALTNYYAALLSRLEAIKDMTLFVTSFSEHGDLLSQWRAYTQNGIGFSVGFEYDHLQKLAEAHNFSIIKCVYKESEHDLIVEEIIDVGRGLVEAGEEDNAVLAFFVGLVTYAPALKHPSFSEEREWRLVSEIVRPPVQTGANQTPAPINFRSGKSMLIPYREFKLAEANSRMSISKIFVGPTPHMDLSISSALQLLLTSEVDNWRIVASSVPYRSW
jgi:hypothetical protein